jgi:lipopolysaccharide cholinephosphotransferase
MKGQVSMKKLTSEEIKQYELDILLDIQRFCEEYSLKFYLSGGTLLGAIRHHGFIPWDDDIDICMPRPDYIKFVHNYNSDKGFYIKSDILQNWDAPCSKVLNPLTVVKSHISENETGLWVDVFPVDGLPADIREVEKIYKKCDFYRKLYWNGHAKLGTGNSALHRYSKYVLKPLINIYGCARISAKIERIAQKYAYETSDYVGTITWGIYGVGERMLKKEFVKEVNVTFEKHQFPAFSCWDSYLRGLYHDYMKLPPIEERKDHNMDVYIKV